MGQNESRRDRVTPPMLHQKAPFQLPLLRRSTTKMGDILTRQLYKGGPGRELGEGYKFLGLGLQFAGGIVFFSVGGVFLDRWSGLMPLFTLVGTLTGATLSFINVYIKLQAFSEADKRRKEEHKK